MALTRLRAGRRSQGVRLSLASAAFVLLGVALRDRVPWYATAFFALCFVAGVLMLFGFLPRDRPESGDLTIDDVGITRTGPRLREHVAWGNITRVRIMTTDQGPWREDIFFVIDSKNGDGCVVPQDLAVHGGLLEALQTRLDGLDNGAVIEAMGSAQNRVFTIWEEKGRLTGEASGHEGA